MALNPYILMQKAVDIVQQSEHPTNKVAASLAGTDALGTEYSLARTNYWPGSIKVRIGTEQRIGNSSGTVHAETACLLQAPQTEGASLFVTDVPCPNCVKNMAEAGVKTMYIDHKGFTKDFAQRRGNHFDNMALRICEKAGISIYRIFRKEQRLEEILKIPVEFSPVIERPAIISKLDNPANKTDFARFIQQKTDYYRDRNFAMAVATNALGKAYLISAESHPCPGFTGQTMESGDEKYSTILQPLNRVMMMAARHGLKINDNYLYASRVPTSRELVDMVGAGLSKFIIGNEMTARDADALTAFQQLKKAGILNVEQ